MTTAAATSVREKLEHAEEIFRACFEDSRQPNYEERLFLSGDCGMSDRQINSEQRRVNRVASALDRAGTTKQREALAKAADAAEDALAGRGAELAAEIEKLQAERSGLEREAATKRKRCDEAQQAVAQLREHVPAFVKSEYDQRRRSLNDTIRRDLLALEGEIKHIEHIADLDPTNRNHIAAIKQAMPAAVRDIGTDVYRKTPGREGEAERRPAQWQVSPEWAAHVEAEKARLPELRKDLAELQSEYDTEMAKLGELLDHYIN